MSPSGVGKLVDVGPERFTGEGYIDVFKDILLPTEIWLSLNLIFFFFFLVWENNPINTAYVVRAWFRQHPEIVALPNPPKSPDLNPIKHVSASMGRDMPRESTRSRFGVIPMNCMDGNNCVPMKGKR